MVGQSCNRNQCGGNGTYSDSNGACVCTTPAPPVPNNYGTSCTSQPNNCGDKVSGTIGCESICTATTPPNRTCDVPPVVCDPHESQVCEGTTLVTRRYQGNVPNCNQYVVSRQDNYPSCIIQQPKCIDAQAENYNQL